MWGRFRRAIESADAELLASVADYEDVLVSLIGNVAASYVRTRVFEERLAVARGNVSLQNRSLEIASAKFDNGIVTELDQAQARSLLRDTQALIPDLETALRQEQNTLCVLLGIAPRDLGDILGGPGSIPGAPSEAAVGIPADLLRRRPDVRRAERKVAAQSARIGVAESELYPRFSLVGNISLEAEDFKDLFEGDSLQGFGGPSGNVAPDLAWSGAPEGTDSFAVTVYDPDAPTGSGWWHWFAFNIPSDVAELPAGAAMPYGAIELANDYGSTGFGGACPPPGEVHRYQFTVHALGTTLEIDDSVSNALAGYMVNANSIGSASITAVYSR